MRDWLTERIIETVGQNPQGLTKRQIASALGADALAVSSQVSQLVKQRRLATSEHRDQRNPRAHIYILGKRANERWVHGRWVAFDK